MDMNPFRAYGSLLILEYIADKTRDAFENCWIQHVPELNTLNGNIQTLS